MNWSLQGPCVLDWWKEVSTSDEQGKQERGETLTYEEANTSTDGDSERSWNHSS